MKKNATLKKNLIYVSLCIVVSLLQLTPLATEIRFLFLWPLIPLIVSISMFDGELYGTVYAAVCGILWDVCYGGVDGVHALLLAVIGCVCGLLFRLLLRTMVKNFALICGVAILVTYLFFYFIELYIPLGDFEFKILLSQYLPSAILTFAISFAFYYLVKYIHTEFTELGA